MVAAIVLEGLQEDTRHNVVQVSSGLPSLTTSRRVARSRVQGVNLCWPSITRKGATPEGVAPKDFVTIEPTKWRSSVLPSSTTS